MMTCKELKNKYLDDSIALRKQYQADCNARLAEIHLNGLVKRKEDGQVGILRIGEYRFEFFPLTKKGTPRTYQDGYVSNPETEFEPCDPSYKGE